LKDLQASEVEEADRTSLQYCQDAWTDCGVASPLWLSIVDSMFLSARFKWVGFNSSVPTY
jgi:hypothetical protein